MIKPIFLVFSLLICANCCAQEACIENQELQNIWMSTSSGIWENESASGIYKALVVRKMGRESSSDEVKIQLVERTKNNELKILKTIVLDTPGYKGYVENITLHPIDKSLVALYVDINMKAMGGIVMREVYIINAKGEAKKLSVAESQDIY